MTESTPLAHILITFGGLFIIGLLADLAGRHTPLPRVTLLLVAGCLIGPSGLDWLPAFTTEWFPVLTDVALAMIGFLLGQNITPARLGELGRAVIAISLGVLVVTVVLVFGVLALVGVPLEAALLLAGIAPATAPAAIFDVVREYRARGTFTDTLLGIVAIDDAWGLLMFSLLLATAQAIGGHAGALDALAFGIREIGGALLVGLALGLPVAYFTGRIRAGEPTQSEALGAVLLAAGFAEWLEVSYIMSTMALGAVVANFARHHTRPFRAIEGIEWPFLILFFLLAGAALHVPSLFDAGALVILYIVLRLAGRLIGAALGARFAGSDSLTRRWMGLALMPQAGVAIGMALLASQRFPAMEDLVLPVVLGATIVFEVFGPVLTRRALIRAGEIAANGAAREIRL